jgi:hypothetical protein
MKQIFCRHLRTKSMYTGKSPEEAFAEKAPEHATPCHVWCKRTQSVVGVDDRPVGKNLCNSTRSCFEE